ncbi:hypothetical protein QFZ82_002170 [Streptomyces sp. V4I23]|nr:hypothetical protein [Streptomyces sp. V4I23]MDQ1007685.1 hypothetical protein [Streptomyces sp. V4I23]
MVILWLASPRGASHFCRSFRWKNYVAELGWNTYRLLFRRNAKGRTPR